MTEKRRKYLDIIREIFSGKILSREFFRNHAKLALLVVILAFLYIYNSFEVNAQVATIKRLKEDIKEARYTMLELSAEHTQMTRSSEISKELHKRGSKVEESVTPPIQVK